MVHSYKTISKPSEETLFKEKGSKFFGYAFPVSTEEEVKKHIEEIRKLHHGARHWCYAYRLGAEGKVYRMNDDGEPSNAAGKPIYGQLLAFDVTNVLVVVARYFGGVKLGVGGMIQSYRASAELSLQVADIIEKEIKRQVQVSVSYAHMNSLMRLIKELNLEVISSNMEIECKYVLSCNIKKYPQVLTRLKENHNLVVKEIG